MTVAEGSLFQIGWSGKASEEVTSELGEMVQVKAMASAKALRQAVLSLSEEQ